MDFRGLPKDFFRILAHWIFGDYAIYRIYQSDWTEDEDKEIDFKYKIKPILNGKELDTAIDPAIRNLANYHGKESIGFAMFDGNVAVSACWYWFGKRYKQRNFWPLKTKQAKLVQIVTDKEFRGKGLACRLIRDSTREMRTLGFERLYARVWHSNIPSISVFESAGWLYLAFVVEIFPFGKKRPIRIVRRWPRK